MAPFNLQKGCSSIPWQGGYVPLAIRINGVDYTIQQITMSEMDKLRGVDPDTDDVPGLPIVAALYDDRLVVYPSPNDAYLVVECG
jgi:hypothetical protein